MFIVLSCGVVLSVGREHRTWHDLYPVFRVLRVTADSRIARSVFHVSSYLHYVLRV